MRRGGVVIATMVVGLLVGASCSGDRQDGVFIDGAEVTTFCASLATMEREMMPALEDALAPVNDDQATWTVNSVDGIDDLIMRFHEANEGLDAIDRSVWELDPWADDAVATLLRSNRALNDDLIEALEAFREQPSDIDTLGVTVTDSAAATFDQLNRLAQSLETGYNAATGVVFTLDELEIACNEAADAGDA